VILIQIAVKSIYQYYIYDTFYIFIFYHIHFEGIQNVNVKFYRHIGSNSSKMEVENRYELDNRETPKVCFPSFANDCEG